MQGTKTEDVFLCTSKRSIQQTGTLGIIFFVPAWLTAAGIDVDRKYITPFAPPVSYMGPGVAGFMIIGVIYLIYLYRRHPQRVEEVGLVHLDPNEEYEAEA